MPADRNLLFGILALQMDFITRDQLVAAMNTWVLDKQKPLGEILVALGAMKSSDLALLEPLVARHIEQHGNDPQKSLAALSSVSGVRERLQSVADADVQVSLGFFGIDTQSTIHHAGTASDGIRYRVLRPHAQGGLGEVFVAEDTEVHRQVALKEIQRRHAGDAGSRGRFLLEAEITGRLEHPGIVPVYGLGVYPDGRPYYAMRFIKGDNLGEAISRFHGTQGAAHEVSGTASSAYIGHGSFDSLEFRRLLQRFIDVCNAVAYAHSRGVLHRDLKPGNIMLGEFGETLLVDWGLAKVVGRTDVTAGDATILPSSGSGSVDTLAGTAMGTPAFMSPEQAEGKVNELGPATDVYSLGATLYMLLTGRPPIEKGKLAEMLEKVRRGDIAPPRSVQPTVPRALDAVCRKAMARRPSDRYVTAKALADDVEHWLADERVGAAPEPFTVQARRWMRKHPGPVGGIAAALLVGVCATAALAWQRERARSTLAVEQALTAGERDAKEVARQQAVQERDRADEERRIALAVQHFLNDKLLLQADASVQADSLLMAGIPTSEAERDPRVSTLLDRAAKEVTPDKIDSLFPGQVVVQVTVLRSIGRSYAAIGQFDAGIAHLQRSYDLSASRLGVEYPETMATLRSIARAYFNAGRLEEAENKLVVLADIRKKQLGDEHPETLEALHDLAMSHLMLGRPDTVERLEKLLPVAQRVFGPDDLNVLISIANLGSAYVHKGKLTKAVALLQRSTDGIRRRCGADHPVLIQHLQNLATAHVELGSSDEALRVTEQARNIAVSKLGAQHPMTLTLMKGLAERYIEADRFAEAVSILEPLCVGLDSHYGADHPATFAGRQVLGRAYKKVGRTDEAIRIHQQLCDVIEAKYGPDRSYTWDFKNELGSTLFEANRLTEALAIYETIAKAAETKHGIDHPGTMSFKHNCASTYQRLGRTAEAIRLWRTLAEALEKRSFKSKSAEMAINGLANALEGASQLAEAASWRQKWLEFVKREAGADSRRFAEAAANLGYNLLHQAKFAEAEPILRDALEVRLKLEPDQWTTFNCYSMLGGALLGQKKHADAEPMLLRGYDGMKQREDKMPKTGGTVRRIPEAIDRLIELYIATNKPEEVTKWQAERAKYPEAKKEAGKK